MVGGSSFLIEETKRSFAEIVASSQGSLLMSFPLSKLKRWIISPDLG
jgi:hypothetical protein